MYIFWFLHQTTTRWCWYHIWGRCISFDSYIKPQPKSSVIIIFAVVYLLIPTSNHNQRSIIFERHSVVYLLIPTSNHNTLWLMNMMLFVVYLLIPTSNHNCKKEVREMTEVVYLLIPTSNHNLKSLRNIISMLYIFWFLHQTTTIGVNCFVTSSCISFDSYIKPQLACNGI